MVAVYVTPAINGVFPMMVVELPIVEPGAIDPMNLKGVVILLVLRLFNEIIEMLVMALVPAFCIVMVSVAVLPAPGTRK